MPVYEQTIVECDYCNAEAVLSGYAQLRSAREADQIAVPGTHIRIPEGWEFYHGKYVCPKHIVTVSEK